VSFDAEFIHLIIHKFNQYMLQQRYYRSGNNDEYEIISQLFELMILKEQSFVKRYNIHKKTRRNGAYEYVSTSGPPTYEQNKLNLFWQQNNKQIFIHQAMLNSLFNFK
jgi:hypothetical protein